MKLARSLAIAALAVLATSAAAQLLPPVDRMVGRIDQFGRGLVDGVQDVAAESRAQVNRLVRIRSERLAELVRHHANDLELDSRGDVAVRGELIMIDPDDRSIDSAQAAGFAIIDSENLEGLGARAVRLRIPDGLSLRSAEKRLRAAAPSATIQSNPIYEQSGELSASIAGGSGPSSLVASPCRIGLIDGGVAAHPTLPAGIVQQGFAGPVAANAHATAIASILIGRGRINGVAPDARLCVADIYGSAPRGGNALAIARAVGWLMRSGVSVINISLVGPDNPLLARAAMAAEAQGVSMVAAVGNDGPAAPPTYPASYPQVIAVTGIDGKGRILIEAGRALHVDFAAPGADLLAAAAGGAIGPVRGTSFAAPFVAARLALLPAGRRPRQTAIAILSAQAGKPPKGARAILYGTGIICAACATHMR